MAFSAQSRRGFGVRRQRVWLSAPRVQAIFGSTLAAAAALLSAWTLCGIFAAPRSSPPQAFTLALATEEPAPRSDPAAARFAARFYLGAGSLATVVPDLTPSLEGPFLQATAPAIGVAPSASQNRRVARLAHSAPARSPVSRVRQNSGPATDDPQLLAAANPPAREPTLLEKLFGRSKSAIFEKLYGRSPSGVRLAYAAPFAGLVGDDSNVTAGLYDRQTAVYDISARTVYLPDGTTLEAHSGYHEFLDDTRYARVRNRGVTPPDIYNLEPRERLFHGVQALRLIPVDESKVFGRSGLLAHTYMLGPNGDSNGCVSFKDYGAFLNAYNSGLIKRLAVVTSID
jgi:hypothetical protein